MKVEEKRRRINGGEVSFIPGVAYVVDMRIDYVFDLRDDYVVDLGYVAMVVYDPTPRGLSRWITQLGTSTLNA